MPKLLLPTDPCPGALAPDTPRCFHRHLGLWCCEPLWLGQMLSTVQAGLWTPTGRQETPSAATRAEARPYALEGGVAIVPLMGPLTKAGSWKFDETSTVQVRRMLRQATADSKVEAILLHIDSPGGHVAGTEALAADVARAALEKPVTAHIDDLGASAAYWIASQATTITANTTAEVGSIGTYAVLEDSSGQMDRLGIKVHVIGAGAYKGIGVDGAPLTEQALEYVQGRIADLNQHFLAAVSAGRRASPSTVGTWADGRVHIAQKALTMGLIDQVQSLEASLDQLQRPQARASARAARVRAWAFYQWRAAAHA